MHRIMDAYDMHLAVVALVGVSLLLYQPTSCTENQLLEFAKTMEREREDFEYDSPRQLKKYATTAAVRRNNASRKGNNGYYHSASISMPNVTMIAGAGDANGLFDGLLLSNSDYFQQPILNKFLEMGRPAWKEPPAPPFDVAELKLWSFYRTLDHRQKLHNTRQRIMQLVKETSAKLKSLSDSVHSISESCSHEARDLSSGQLILRSGN